VTDTDTTTASIADRLEQLQERIHRAATSAGRDSSDITLVAVTKTHSPAIIETAYELGLRHFGENRVEEAAEKLPNLSQHSDIVWHMVGHIQSRKAKDVAQLFSWVHSVDRLKIAQRLSQQAAEMGRALDVLLEVNLSGEASKYGFDVSDTQFGEFIKAVETILALPNLRVGGLMTMAPFTHDAETTRPVFAGMASLRDELAKRYPDTAWRHLSMGMTGDFEVAIQEGATLLRIGQAVFGPRGQLRTRY
jgi:pyridoxal phosphate enzyme (YggS family)